MHLGLNTATARDLTEVIAEHAEDFEFNKTRTVIRLFNIGTERADSGDVRPRFDGWGA